MVAVKPDAYDEFAYLNYAYSYTHPDQMGTLARLFGMEPAPVNGCRVLEVGCGDGANLLPMAQGLPNSQFIGIDRAMKPIENGQAMISTLQLRNIELHQFDLMNLPEELGQFDYIIAHGLYSWVPAEVRDGILALCRARLTPHGVAYVSYNAYPGCHLRNIARELMLFHTRAAHEPFEKVGQGRALIKWLADARPHEGIYPALLREFSSHYQSKTQAAIYHDDLAEINAPVYFYEFVAHAASHGLQFLSEAVHFDAAEHNFPAEVAESLRQLGQQDPLAKSQYLDFLEGRAFRQTLLCHQERLLDRIPKSEIVTNFYLRSRAKPTSENPDLKSISTEEFKTPTSGTIATDFPLAKMAIFYLNEIYPDSIDFEGLVNEACKRLETSTYGKQDQEAQALAEIILKAYGANVIELHLHQTAVARIPGEQPVASPLARLQAKQGGLCTSLLHETIKFEDFLSQQLIMLLDGTRDRAALRQEMSELINSSEFVLTQGKEPEAQREELLEALPDKLEVKLNELGRMGFLLK